MAKTLTAEQLTPYLPMELPRASWRFTRRELLALGKYIDGEKLTVRDAENVQSARSKIRLRRSRQNTR